MMVQNQGRKRGGQRATAAIKSSALSTVVESHNNDIIIITFYSNRPPCAHIQLGQGFTPDRAKNPKGWGDLFFSFHSYLISASVISIMVFDWSKRGSVSSGSSSTYKKMTSERIDYLCFTGALTSSLAASSSRSRLGTRMLLRVSSPSEVN